MFSIRTSWSRNILKYFFIELSRLNVSVAVKQKCYVSCCDTETEKDMCKYVFNLTCSRLCRNSLKMCSAPTVIQLWVSAWRRQRHTLYWCTGNGRGMVRWEEPAAGAETASSDAAEDAYLHACIISKGPPFGGWGKQETFNSVILDHLCERHTPSHTGVGIWFLGKTERLFKWKYNHCVSEQISLWHSSETIYWDILVSI